MNLRQSFERFCEVSPLPLLLLALLLGARGDLLAQERSPANDSFDSDRVTVPSSEAEPAPSSSVPDTPPDSSSGAPPDSSSDTTPDSSSGTPPDSSSEEASPDSSNGSPPDSPADTPAPPERYAVPVTPDTPNEPHRQPPYRGRYAVPDTPVEPPTSDDDAVPDESPVESYQPYGSPGGNPYPSGRQYRGRGGRGAAGGLDLDVSPGRTQVYLDGYYVGTVDRYDGWPSYLWLEKGTYDLVFYLDGYKTLARRVTIDPGTVIKIYDRLEPGPSIRPELLLDRRAPTPPATSF